MKRYAMSDIHGNYNLLQDILKYCEEDSEIYFLGDAADRGPDGLKCMELLLNDSRVKYLMGNHEKMFIDAYLEYKRKQNGVIDNFFGDNKLLLWLSNGGDKTWLPFLEDYTQEQKDILFHKIRNLPTYIYFTNKNNKTLLLCHAGTDYPTDLSMSDILWDRSHLRKTHWTDRDDIYVVHGHTPVNSHYFNKQEVVEYCDNHMIDIDMGTYVSNKVALLDLDSVGNKLEVTYFTTTLIN